MSGRPNEVTIDLLVVGRGKRNNVLRDLLGDNHCPG
jgi:hypothetical protein